MTLAIELLALPFVACAVLAGIHAYFGLHVLGRGVIFVDLALAQVAALGMTAALLAGHGPQSDAAYYYALAFTALAAGVFALARRPESPAGAHAVPQEALIGIVYAAAAALTVLALDRVPQGGEQIKQLLVGGLLGVTADEVARVAALYAGVGVLHWLCRRPLLTLAAGGSVPHAAAWDFLFYLTLGLVVTSSVRIAGVLLVFSYLIVPAVVGTWLADSLPRRLVVALVIGVSVSALGLGAAFAWDLPTGAAIVATFAAALAATALFRGAVALARRLRRDGARILRATAGVAGALVFLLGAGLAVFPGADHFWLDVIERAAPAVRDVFLTAAERQVVAESAAAIERGTAELGRLRALQADAQWGTRDLGPEQRERLRQFLAGRDELVAGDRLVLRTLRQRVRERQRFVVGVPLALGGAAVTVAAMVAPRWRRRRRGESPRMPPATPAEVSRTSRC
ncbi:MAG TPA: metal ABC transporter permease [Methylomirabilota bacterium]|jgi:zinc/manganese transport system permease protein